MSDDRDAADEGLAVRLPGGRGDGRDDLGTRIPQLSGLRALGYDADYYYYLSPAMQMVCALGAAEHVEPVLLKLARLHVWQAGFPTKSGRGEFDVSRARDVLIAACHEAGIFEPETVKGRGVWWHREHGAVVHDGSFVTVDGAGWRPSDCPLAEVFEAGPSWGRLLGPALRPDETTPLLDVLEPLPWAHPSHALLCAGWIALAGVCGALRWRPHLALTGPAGSGKSWLATTLMVGLLAPLVLHVEGETTSAGIRQTLRRDARPVVWDEAEQGGGGKGQARIQDMLALARSMSGGGQGQVLKGGSRHRAAAFAGSAMLCLVSVHTSATREADTTRLTTLELVGRRAVGAIDEAGRRRQQRALDRLGDPAFRAGLLGRMVRLLPELRASQLAFAAAAAARYGSQRAGDQVGSLLAGAWHLGSDETVRPAEAVALVAGLAEDLAGEAVVLSDEQRCLQSLASFPARVDTHGGKRQVTRSVGQLVYQCLKGLEHDDVSATEATNVLGRLGVKVALAGAEVAIANSHDQLARLFKGHDYATSWAKMFERLPGARKSAKALRFGPGVVSRATVLPGSLFMAGEPADPPADPPM